MKSKIINILQESVNKIGANVSVELTPSKGHGDFSTNIAMKLTKELKDNPQNIAKRIIKVTKSDIIEKMEVAGPGFINIFLKNDIFSSLLMEIIEKGNDYGKGNQGKYINIEYVSANPTGYLHLGHARGAALGATLASILKFAGNKVDQEYYINDAGNQIETLGISAWTRYQQEFGVDVALPEDSYRGNDIVDLAKHLVDKFRDKYKGSPYNDVKEVFKSDAKEWLLDVIRKHLNRFGVKFDIYSSEKSLYDNNKIKPALERLSKHTFNEEGALWLDTTSKGDDKNRVLIKNDGKYTYFAPDIAYHAIKLDRGYDELINIWGADHIGYIKRMEVALEYLGLPSDKLDILTVQLVKLIKDGKELKMSKRMGTSFTLNELIDIAGKDAVRFHMINRANTSKFDFDVNEATKKSNDNPVFTIQYTHARANTIISKTDKEPKPSNYEAKEIDLINQLIKFPVLIDNIASNHKVHLLNQYLIDLARNFNSFYSSTKIIGSKREEALLALVYATKIVLSNGLKLLGVSAPLKM